MDQKVVTQVVTLDQLFRALADPTRLRILGLLLGGEVCVCDIHESLGIPQPKVSRHLAYLRRTGVVEARRDGLWMHYRIAAPRDPVVGGVLDAVRHALTHVRAVQADGEKLQRRTGARPASFDAPARPACCGRPVA